MNKSEKVLAKEIIRISSNGIQITSNLIHKLATQQYFAPWILAERCAYQIIGSKGDSIYNDDQKTELTDEFKELSSSIFSEINEALEKLKNEQKGNEDILSNEEMMQNM